MSGYGYYEACCESPDLEQISIEGSVTVGARRCRNCEAVVVVTAEWAADLACTHPIPVQPAMEKP